MKSGAVFLRGLRASHFRFLYNPATVARMFGGFASSLEAKSASRSEALSASHSERATFAFINICYNSKNRGGTLYAKGYR